MGYLEKINSPKDLKKLDMNALKLLADEIRGFLVDSVSKTGGHLSPVSVWWSLRLRCITVLTVRGINLCGMLGIRPMCISC